MRTLNRNKTKLWYVKPASKAEKIDEDGFYTGEFVSTFGTPEIVYLHLYPANGKITRDLFGIDASLDMVSVSNEVTLQKDGLLFLTEPVSDYATTYDYRVDMINESLNTFAYGLKRKK